MPDISIRKFLLWNGFDPTVGIRVMLPESSDRSLRRLLTMEAQDLDRVKADEQTSFSEPPIQPIVWQGFKTPTLTYKEEGYYYDELTETWKEMCSGLPCFDALHWPDYSTLHIDVELMGMPVVIQMWKGWCQRFLGSQSFPGGIGAEVGIYHRVPGQKLPDLAPFLPEAFKNYIIKTIESISDSEMWWPVTDPEFLRSLEIEFELWNPVNDELFYRAGPVKNTYWLAKWMTEASYIKYQFLNRNPFLSVDYKFILKINGKQFYRW